VADCSSSVPSPFFVKPPLPLIAPLMIASIATAAALLISIVRTALPRSIGFWKSTVCVAEVAPR
jgi:hypothetical protein